MKKTFYITIGITVVLGLILATTPVYAKGKSFIKQLESLISFNNKGNKIGIGLKNPKSRLSVKGKIESTRGGFKFPDGSVQTTSAITIMEDGSLCIGNCGEVLEGELENISTPPEDNSIENEEETVNEENNEPEEVDTPTTPEEEEQEQVNDMPEENIQADENEEESDQEGEVSEDNEEEDDDNPENNDSLPEANQE